MSIVFGDDFSNVMIHGIQWRYREEGGGGPQQHKIGDTLVGYGKADPIPTQRRSPTWTSIS
jgi:hypothetical protein